MKRFIITRADPNGMFCTDLSACRTLGLAVDDFDGDEDWMVGGGPSGTIYIPFVCEDQTIILNVREV